MGTFLPVASLVTALAFTGILFISEPPTIQIDTGPEEGAVIDSASVYFGWSADDIDGTVDSFIVALEGPSPDSFITTDSTAAFQMLLDGAYTFCVQAKDNDGDLSLAACRSFSISIPLPNEAPSVQINLGPEDGSGIDFNDPLFSWTGSDTDGLIDSFLVQLDGPSPDSFATADTSYQFTGLLDGAYAFCITARDDLGALSDEACRSFTVAVPLPNEAPTVQINQGPEEGSLIDFDDPLFSWAGADTDGLIDSFLVHLDGPSPDSFATADTSYQFTGLLDGAYAFCITARDDIGALSDEACRSFSVEVPVPNEAPAVQINLGPEEGSTIDVADPLFSWAGTDTDGLIDSFLVHLDGPSPDSFAIADTSFQFSNLLDGAYAFCITARDNLGALSNEACRSFSVALPPPNEIPTVQITSGPEEGSIIDFADPLFSWDGTDADGLIDSFLVHLDGPSPDSFATADTLHQLSQLANGAYSFCVTARDTLGALSEEACRSFSVDVNLPPTVQIDNGPEDGAVLTYSNPAFTWSGTDTDGTIISYHVMLSGASADTFATANTFIQFEPLVNGDYTFCVQSEDDDIAVSDVACRQFTIDLPTINLPPIVQISNGPAQDSTILFNNPAFTWTGEDTDGVIDSFFVELRGASFLSFSTIETFYQANNLPNGDHEFCVRTRDDDAFYSEWECRAFAVYVESANLPPEVSIDNAPAEGDTLVINNPAFTWSGLDADGTVDSFYVSLDGPVPSSFTTTSTFHQFTALQNGDYSFCVQSKDNVGALSELICRSFVIDIDLPNAVPTVTIENGPEDQSTITFNNPAFSWTGSDEDGTVESYTIELIGPTPLNTTTTGSFIQLPTLSSGAYTFCIQAVDNAGALSGWTCRTFIINGAFTASIKDLMISSDGVILEVPLVNQLVEVYASSTLVTTTTTNQQGLFTLQGLFDGTAYELRIFHPETIDGLDDPVILEYTSPIDAENLSDLILPRSLAIDQFEVLASLSDIAFPEEYTGAGSDLDLPGASYNVDQLESPLQEWLASLGPDSAPVYEALLRTYIASATVDNAASQARLLSHELSRSIFLMLETYLTSREHIQKLQADLTSLGNPAAIEVNDILLRHIDALNYKWMIDHSLRSSSSLIPPPYKAAVINGAIAMVDTILNQAAFELNSGTRYRTGMDEEEEKNAILKASDYLFFSEAYIPYTRPLLDALQESMSASVTQGTFTDAYSKTLSNDSQSITGYINSLSLNTRLQSDSLLSASGMPAHLRQYTELLNTPFSFPSIETLQASNDATSPTLVSEAAYLYGKGLANIEESVLKSVTYAFNPDQATGASEIPALSHLPSDTYSTSHLPNKDTYLELAGSVITRIENGQRDIAISLLPGLIQAELQYARELAELQAPIWQAAIELTQRSQDEYEMYKELNTLLFSSLKQRIGLYLDLVRYVNNDAFDTSRLRTRLNAISQQINDAELVSKLLNVGLLGRPRSFIAISEHSFAEPYVTPGTPIEITATLTNTGSAPATDITTRLKTDSTLTFLSPPYLLIPALDPGQSATLRWEVFSESFTHSGGMYAIEAHMADSVFLFSSGTYDVRLPLNTTSNEDTTPLPTEFALHAPYPNPFNANATIRYDVPQPSTVTITLFDMLGRSVHTLVDGAAEAGRHAVQFQAANLPSGAYIMRMTSTHFTATKSIVIAR